MSDLNIDLNTSPYFDDYSDEKQFYRMLFIPRRPIQAREATQLQTILQKQISRFGSHVFKNGTIVDGVAINYIPRFNYVHLVNNFNNSVLTNPTDISNDWLITNSLNSSEAIRAVPVLKKDGFVSNYPETNRIYLQYITTGKDNLGNDRSIFNAGETLYIFNEEQDKLGTLDPSNVVDTINVIPSSPGVDATGIAYGVKVSEGIIFHKGFFALVNAQTITVRDFDRNVDQYLVGFETIESIITESQDPSLRDNAAGFPNFNAPGAHRLKLDPRLIAVRRDQVTSETFFPIVTFDEDEPAQEASDPVYNKLGDEFAKRTYEKSGDFYVKPFGVETVPSANSENFTYEVSPGIAYVKGYRVEFVGTNRISVPRASTTKVAQNQVITANYGNYISVEEVLGAAEIENISEVALYDAPQNSISQYEGISGSPTGSIVGYANIKALTYSSGVKGKPDCVYFLYLFNVRMEPGKTFSIDAKSYVSTSGRAARGDFVLTNGRAVIRDTNRQKLVFDTGHASIRRLTDGSGFNDTSYVYRQTSTATLQSNGFATFTLNTPAPGASESINFSVGSVSEQGKNQFNIFLSQNAFTTNATGTMDVVSGNTVINGTGTSFDTEFSVNDLIRINLGGSGFQIRRIVDIADALTLEIDTPIGVSNTTANFQKFFVGGSPLDLSGLANNVTVISNTQFQIATNLSLDSGSQSVFGQYPVNRNLAVPTRKQIRKNRLVKIDPDTNAGGISGPWNLGLVDVNRIRNVWVGTSYANTNPDRLDWFVLDNGQRDTHYEHARIFIRPEHASKINSSTKILVNVDHFIANTSAGVGYFSIDSYPIDDANTANATAITTALIPSYSSTTGRVFDLRNSVDFRPYKFNTASSIANTDPANTSITVNPGTSNSAFSTAVGGQFHVDVDTSFRADIEYYLPRIDLVTIDKSGTLGVTQGLPEENPRTPFSENDTSVIARAFIPAYPSLTQREAEAVGRRDIGIRIEPQGNPRYTEKDIGQLDRRLKRIEYYTVLNTLEQKARDLTIPDANGLDRFKNGIFADPFNSHNIGKVSDFEYSISIDKDNGIARPLFKSHPVDFKYESSLSSGVVKTGPYVTLPFTKEIFITQSYATKFRNATELQWQWNGNINLFPEQDYFRDENFLPNININLDLASPWEQFASSQFGTVFGDWRTVSEQTRQTGGGTTQFQGGSVQSSQFESTSTQDRIITELNVDVMTNQYDFGSYITDFSIQPYMRSREVAFVATSLKPNTRIFAHFDSKPVSIHCAPGILSGITDVESGQENRVVERTGNYGDPLVTDSNGFICGIFRIPEGEFRTGDRIFTLNDISDMSVGEDAVITKASGTYHASSVSVTKQNATLSTREPTVRINSTVETRTLVNSFSVDSFVPAPPPVQEGGNGDGDPFAQSFLVKVPSNVTGCFMSSIGLYFRDKDPNLGVTVYVMEMRGGKPDYSNVIGKAYLPSSAVNAPGDNTQIETVFDFDFPIYLTKDKFYAFLIHPDADSPEYRLWFAETGGFDVETGIQIFKNPYVGTAFQSANKLSWTTLQNEDIKFNIYRARFNVGSGTAIFENEDDEYLVVDGFVRTNSSLPVQIGDVVYTVDPSSNNTLVSNTDPFGIVQFVDEASGTIQLDSSRGGFTSNTDIRVYRVSNENDIAQIVSNNIIATATIDDVDNLPYHMVVPRFAKMTPSGTNLRFAFKGTDITGNRDSVFFNVQNDTETEFLDRERFAYSKSNEGLEKSSQFSVELQTLNSFVSPVIDLGRKSSLFIENIINFDVTGEETRYGNALTKYISKNVVLKDGFDAEDMELYVTAYRPVDTDIRVYVKFQNGEDAEPFDDKLWTELEFDGGSENVFSNPVNTSNFIEYKFNIPTSTAFPEGAFRNPSTGILEYVNGAGARFVTYKTFSVKIVLLSSNKVRVPRLNDVRAIALMT